MKKIILFLMVAFIITTHVNASITSVEKRTSKIETKSVVQIKSNSFVLLAPTLVASYTSTTNCSDGSVYVQTWLVWQNTDGSVYIQTVTYGNECPVPPPSPV